MTTLLGGLALFAVVPAAYAWDVCDRAEAGAPCGMGPASVLGLAYVRVDVVLSHGGFR